MLYRCKFRMLIMFVLFSVLTCSIGTTTLYSQESPKNAKQNPVRILLIVGGHGYDKAPLNKMLSEMPGAVLKTIELPKDQDLLSPGIDKDYDVLVFHDQSRFELTKNQKKNMEDMWSKGIPTVMLHHALIAHNDYPLFREVYGSAYLIKETEINGRKYKASSYKKPAEVNLIMVDQDHPITRGMKNFTLKDEVFDNLYLNPAINVLVRTDHPQSTSAQVWTWHYGASPVFAIIPGDNGTAFNNANYRQLVYRGIAWTINEMKKSSK